MKRRFKRFLDFFNGYDEAGAICAMALAGIYPRNTGNNEKEVINSKEGTTMNMSIKPVSESVAKKTAEAYGAFYLNDGDYKHNRPSDLYSYFALCGNNEEIEVEPGDSLITLSSDLTTAKWLPGGRKYMTYGFACILRGYQCGLKTASVDQNVNLPYVNGCATRQIFPPERIGDPTFQQLTIPPFTSEQMHHIHSTARVVYVLSGHGFSIVGQSDHVEETVLKPGMVCVLDPMSPHHFRTEGDYLTVLPVHVFSSAPAGIETNHPMFNGTKEI